MCEHCCCCEAVFKVKCAPISQCNDLCCVCVALTCDTKGISVCSTERVLISSPESKLLLPHGDEAIPAELSLPDTHNARYAAVTEFTKSLSLAVSRLQTGVTDLLLHAGVSVFGYTVVYRVAVHTRTLF